VEEYDPEELRKVAEFTQFRLNLISFLRLPLNVSESALCEILTKCSEGLHASYLARAKRARGDISFTQSGSTEPLERQRPAAT
jgi:hypothetical protein